MHYAVFDVETTGLSNSDEVIQFACIVVGPQFNIERVINFYCYTQHPISSRALEIHGITKELLWQLSGGKTFEDQLDEIDSLTKMKDLIWIDYSTSRFDCRLVNQTLENNGLPGLNFGTPVSTLDVDSGVHTFSILHAMANSYFYGKPRKLMQAASVLPMELTSIEKIFRKYFIEGSNNRIYKEFPKCWHNAEYDAFVTYLLLYYNHERFML